MKLVELLRFSSTKSESGMTSLKDYVKNMKDEQTKIYYITADNIKAARCSPFIEKLQKKKIEVLFMVDTIDEYMVQSIKDYDGKTLVCCTKDGFEIEGDNDSKEDKELLKKEWEGVCKKIKEALGNRVSSVRLSERLESNPCVLVSDQYGWSANMEKIMKAQALSQPGMNANAFGSRKIFEINPKHKIMEEIKQCVTDEKEIKNTVDLLYDTVMLDSGFDLEEPSKYAQCIYRLIACGLSIKDEEEPKEEVQIPETTDVTSMEDVD